MKRDFLTPHETELVESRSVLFVFNVMNSTRTVHEFRKVTFNSF